VDLAPRASRHWLDSARLLRRGPARDPPGGNHPPWSATVWLEADDASTDHPALLPARAGFLLAARAPACGPGLPLAALPVRELEAPASRSGSIGGSRAGRSWGRGLRWGASTGAGAGAFATFRRDLASAWGQPRGRTVPWPLAVASVACDATPSDLLETSQELAAKRRSGGARRQLMRPITLPETIARSPPGKANGSAMWLVVRRSKPGRPGRRPHFAGCMLQF